VFGAIGHECSQVTLLPFYLRRSLIGVRTGNWTQMTALWQDVRDGFRLCDELIGTAPWTQALQAHATIEEGTATGQIVLQVA